MNLKFGNFADASVQSQADVTYTFAEAVQDIGSGVTYQTCASEATEVAKAICYSKRVAQSFYYGAQF